MNNTLNKIAKNLSKRFDVNFEVTDNKKAVAYILYTCEDNTELYLHICCTVNNDYKYISCRVDIENSEFILNSLESYKAFIAINEESVNRISLTDDNCLYFEGFMGLVEELDYEAWFVNFLSFTFDFLDSEDSNLIKPYLIKPENN